MSTQLNNLAFFANGDQIAYEPDSLEFTGGKGEYNIRNAVVGGGLTEQVFSEDIKTKYSTFKINLPTTIANVAIVRKLKNNLNQNTLEVNGVVEGETFAQIFTQAALITDPPTKLATEGSIELEFRTNPAQ